MKEETSSQRAFTNDMVKAILSFKAKYDTWPLSFLLAVQAPFEFAIPYA